MVHREHKNLCSRTPTRTCQRSAREKSKMTWRDEYECTGAIRGRYITTQRRHQRLGNDKRECALKKKVSDEISMRNSGAQGFIERASYQAAVQMIWASNISSIGYASATRLVLEEGSSREGGNSALRTFSFSFFFFSVTEHRGVALCIPNVK